MRQQTRFASLQRVWVFSVLQKSCDGWTNAYYESMSQSLDLNDVRIFVATAQSKSMSAAGRTLQIPTSSVSRGVARLERYVGIQLLEREAQGIALTEAGESYLPYCIDALNVLSEAGQSLSGLRQTPGGLLRVACPALMAKEIFAPLIPHFLKEHASIQLELLPYQPGEQGIAPPPADLVFELAPPFNPRTLIRRYPSARRGVYAAESYLQSAPRCTVPSDLKSCNCIGSRAAPYLSQWRLFGPEGSVLVEPHFNVFAADPTLLREMARSGLGVTILPVWMALDRTSHPACVRMLPEWEASPVPLFACVPFGSSFLPSTQSLLEFLDRHLGTERDPRLQHVDPAQAPFCFKVETVVDEEFSLVEATGSLGHDRQGGN